MIQYSIYRNPALIQALLPALTHVLFRSLTQSRYLALPGGETEREGIFGRTTFEKPSLTSKVAYYHSLKLNLIKCGRDSGGGEGTVIRTCGFPSY